MAVSRRVLFSTSVLGGCVALSLLASSASAQERTYTFDIPQERLTKALRDFALASGKQIIFTDNLIGDRQAPALKGLFTVNAALSRLLQGADLSVQTTPAGALMIRRAGDSGQLQNVSAPQPNAPVGAAADGPMSNPGVASAAPMAFAQAEPEGGHVAAAAKAEPSPVVQEVVVTGSRVIKNGNNSPTPVTTVTTDALQSVQPTTLIDALDDLPVFSGSRSQQSNPSPGLAGAGAPASNQLNLRNLGASRTLVLFDGQKFAPTTIINTVDADIIPQMLIQRVDVVTGGASAVYGSDAVVGVVNFIPDTKFNGLKLEAEGGASQYGDNQTWKVGIAAGAQLFGGRGHIEGSYEHYDDAGILNRFSRSWNQMYAVTGAGSAANPYVLESNVRANNSTFGGLIGGAVSAKNPLGGMEFTSDGVLSPFVHGAPTGTSTAEIGGDGSYNTGSMVAPLRMDQFYIRGDYDVTDTIHAHLQVSRDLKFNEQLDGWALIQSYSMSATNPFLSPAYQQQMATAKQTSFTFSERINQQPELTINSTSDQYIVNGGLDGSIGKYKWGLSLNYGASILQDTLHNEPNLENMAAALDAVVNPANGQIVCRTTLTNPGLRPGCVPLNLFGTTAASPAALAYVFKDTHTTADTNTYDVNGSFAGSPFSTWAGPVTTALSGEWRRLTYNSSTDASATALANCTGINFNCNSSSLEWQDTFGARSLVGVNVWETAAEFDAPLVKDAPFIQSFNLNGAVRYMDYSTSGAYWAWKAGIDWHIDDQLRIRGTASRDIRAPNLYEQYAPATFSPDNTQDLLTGQSPNVVNYRQGNPNLTAEIGYTETLGFVYRPDWIPRFSLSVDAFHILVDNAIVEVKGDSTVAQDACYASGGTSPYCALQARPLGFSNTTAANAVTAWYQQNINISSVETYGADVEGNYAGQVAGHRYSLRAFLTWQPHTLYLQPGGVAPDDMGGTAYGPAPLIAQPSLRMTDTESFEVTDRFRVDLVERYRNALRLNGSSGLYVACCTVAPVAYLDMNLSYKVPQPLGDGELFVNIQNLFNQTPPASAPPGTTVPGPAGGWAIGDDPIGRMFMVGFRLKR